MLETGWWRVSEPICRFSLWGTGRSPALEFRSAQNGEKGILVLEKLNTCSSVISSCPVASYIRSDSRAICSYSPSGLVWFRSVSTFRLQMVGGLRTSEDRLREVRAEGEEGEDVGEVGDGGDRPLGTGRAEELTFCSRSNRCCLRAEDRSSASAERFDAERLASSALAWLEEAVREDNTPSWGYLRSLEGSWLEKLAALVLARRDSAVRVLVTLRLVACGDGRRKDTRHREYKL